MKAFRLAFFAMTAGAALALATTGASADGPYRGGLKDGPIAHKWSGCYGGVQGGYAWANTSGRASNSANVQNLNYDYDATGGVAGIHVGCDYRVSPNTVVGVEADWEWAGLSGSQSNIVDVVNFPASFYTHKTEIDGMGSLRLRAGFLMPPDLLVYGTAGWAIADTEHSLGFVGSPPFLKYSEIRHGWTVGGGVEGYVLPNVTMRLEYRFTRLEDGLVLAPAVNARDKLNDTDVHAIRLGLTFRP